MKEGKEFLEQEAPDLVKTPKGKEGVETRGKTQARATVDSLLSTKNKVLFSFFLFLFFPLSLPSFSFSLVPLLVSLPPFLHFLPLLFPFPLYFSLLFFTLPLLCSFRALFYITKKCGNEQKRRKEERRREINR
jgi:hypothetical protein